MYARMMHPDEAEPTDRAQQARHHFLRAIDPEEVAVLEQVRYFAITRAAAEDFSIVESACGDAAKSKN